MPKKLAWHVKCSFERFSIFFSSKSGKKNAESHESFTYFCFENRLGKIFFWRYRMPFWQLFFEFFEHNPKKINQTPQKFWKLFFSQESLRFKILNNNHAESWNSLFFITSWFNSYIRVLVPTFFTWGRLREKKIIAVFAFQSWQAENPIFKYTTRLANSWHSEDTSLTIRMQGLYDISLPEKDVEQKDTPFFPSAGILIIPKLSKNNIYLDTTRYSSSFLFNSTCFTPLSKVSINNLLRKKNFRKAHQ